MGPAARPARTPQQLLHIVSQPCDNELARQIQLRREYPDRLVRGAFALCDLRLQSRREVFPELRKCGFDRQGMEQSTSELVAQHKAKRFSGNVIDLCSGIGGDLPLALAEHCSSVMAVDSNPVSCLRSAWNADVYWECAPRVTTAWANTPPGSISATQARAHRPGPAGLG